MHGQDQDRTGWFLRHVLPHEPALRRWLERRRLPGLDPDDVIQESYAVFADMESVAAIACPRAYLFQVARSVVSRHLRRARVVPIHALGEPGGPDEAADDAPSPERVAIDRDMLRRLGEAMEAMPGQARTAFTLRRVDGLSQREIAGRMAIAESTVEKHIARGIRFLADWLGHGGKDLPIGSSLPKPELPRVDEPSRVQSGHRR
jgi:RNA polymerase sigma-70 factor (ECF subfamily)